MKGCLPIIAWVVVYWILIVVLANLWPQDAWSWGQLGQVIVAWWISNRAEDVVEALL